VETPHHATETEGSPEKENPIMGMELTNTLLLLDENDLDHPYGDDFETFEDLVEALEDHATRLDNGCSSLHLVGYASERFDTTQMGPDSYFTSYWLKEDAPWQAVLTCVFGQQANITGAIVDAFFRTGDLNAFMAALKRHLVQSVIAERYSEVQSLSAAMEDATRAELPGFRHPACYSSSGLSDAYDMRDENHGPGKRVLLEIAHGWD
jgi:hypothetical protein